MRPSWVSLKFAITQTSSRPTSASRGCPGRRPRPARRCGDRRRRRRAHGPGCARARSEASRSAASAWSDRRVIGQQRALRLGPQRERAHVRRRGVVCRPRRVEIPLARGSLLAQRADARELALGPPQLDRRRLALGVRRRRRRPRPVPRGCEPPPERPRARSNASSYSRGVEPHEHLSLLHRAGAPRPAPPARGPAPGRRVDHGHLDEGVVGALPAAQEARRPAPQRRSPAPPAAMPAQRAAPRSGEPPPQRRERAHERLRSSVGCRTPPRKIEVKVSATSSSGCG